MKRFNIQQLALFIMLLIFSSLGAQNQISGVIYYHDNDSNPLPNVVVELYDSGDNLVATTTTNDDGEYEFSNVPYGEYYILSSSTQNFGTLNLIDPSIVLQYLNGTYNLNDFEFVAADVNGNGVVNGGDYNKLMKKILGKKNSFEEEWAFEEVEIDFTARDFEEEVEHWGTSTGDVEGIWMPGGRDLDFLVEYQLPTDLNETEIELEIGSSYKDLISGFNFV
ncbi:MAG TPA: carboxypeptidase-like regulatory domain-containing protein [Bacteroidales bacterium]|nr:carboxypeptidase-like regulatory domain-containing protein [Bacteroidales bacterium]